MLEDYESGSKLGTPGRSHLGLMAVGWQKRIKAHGLGEWMPKAVPGRFESVGFPKG